MVSERCRVDFLVGMRLLLVDVEIVGAARAVVGADEIDDALRDMRLVRHLDAVGHVRDDDFGTFVVREVVVRTVGTVLVLSEIHWIFHLADVVVQSTRTSQKRITTNLEQHLLA